VKPAACAATALLAIGATVGLPAQTFRAATEGVRVDVLVTNGNRPIGGLTRDDFELLDNGVPQAIKNVTIEEVPFSMLLVLDSSASMEGGAIRDLKSAASAAVNAMGAGDRAAILTFSEVLRQPARWLPKGVELTRAIDGVQASGATALFDATFAGLATRDPEAGRRSLLLLFSDGEDTSSWLPASAPIDKAARTETVVYTVFLGPGRGRSADTDRGQTGRAMVTTPAADSESGSRRLFFRSGIRLSPGAALLAQSPFLKEIAERTGGEALVADAAVKLRETFERIVTDFRSRYLLTYVPAGVDTAGWHRLEVKLKNRAGKVRARRGYDRGQDPGK
jgi:Ca-activated chloride channel homolog